VRLPAKRTKLKFVTRTMGTVCTKSQGRRTVAGSATKKLRLFESPLDRTQLSAIMNENAQQLLGKTA
jgi:hypothetical protein